ncbi:MAG: hypothetical protein JXJ22_01840 [Bacteroidales bacterium]|nr:hypothetical protein [Bacteroidales bacterium]
MKLKQIILVSSMLLIVFLLVSCVPGDGKTTIENPAGFFWGIWHGWIAPVSLIWGLFNHSIRVYETINTGWWYDFGFYLAIVGGFGSLSLVRRKKTQKKSSI